jgi:hypothetical protein
MLCHVCACLVSPVNFTIHNMQFIKMKLQGTYASLLCL